MAKIKFECSNIPTFYDFYKLLGEAPVFNPKRFGKPLPSSMAEANLESSIARSLVSASELKKILSHMSPQNNLMVKGSPGQGKSTIIKEYFKTLAETSGLQFADGSEDFYAKLVTEYRDDERFKTDVKKVLSSAYEEAQDDVALENINALQLKTISGMETAIRSLVKLPLDNQVQSFFDRYINNKFFIYNVISDRNERDYFAGQSNITGERSTIDKSASYYGISVNKAWAPYFISKIKGALFIDEVTRIAYSMPEALNAISLLLTERVLGNTRISDNIFAVAAGNFSRSEQGKFTANVGDAFKQRFSPVELSVTVDDFYEYLKSKYSKYKKMNASEIKIPKNWNLTELGNDNIEPEIFLQAGKAAYEVLEYLLTTKPELFLEDKRLTIETDTSSPRYARQKLTRKGVERIKQDPSQAGRVKGDTYLQRRGDVGAIGGDEEAEVEMAKLESANRMIEKSMGEMELIAACYFHIKAAQAEDENDTEAMYEYQDRYKRVLTLLYGKGSPSWQLAIDKIFIEGDYNPLTFRALISRQYKQIDASKLQDVFSTKTWEKQLSPEYAGENLPDIDYEDFKASYNSDSNSRETIMDFAILIKSYKQYFEKNSQLSNIKRGFIVMMDDIRGNTDESKKKYISFVLDYCFKYRPEDAMFLLKNLMNRLPKAGEEGAEEFTADLQGALSGRKNGISDAEIAQAELAAQGMEYKGELPKDQEDEENEEKVQPTTTRKKVK
jgi:hypothetical protein